MKSALTGSFSYRKLDSYSEDTGHSRQRGNDWLTRSFKFLLRSAPHTTAEESRDNYQRTYARQLRQRNSAGESDKQKLTERSRPRSKSAMEQSNSGDANGTQVELRTDGFQATLLWERIVSHLERTVKPGRHTLALRSYDNCFPGHKAVDCLMGYMNSVLPKSVKKSQARLLGQKLLLTRVIEDAKKKEKTVFRESRLYRFTGIHFWDPPRDIHGSRSSCGAATAEGGVYRCHSIENINNACPSTGRDHKRSKPSSRRGNGYMSDSTLASSSLSKRVVQIRSSRGKRSGPDAHSAKSQLSTSIQLTSTSNGLPNGTTSSPYHSQQHTSHRSRLPWFHSDSTARVRDIQYKYRTPTIVEEPAVLRSISPPRASPMTPRSPAIDFKIREPHIPMPRGYPDRPSSPDSSTVSSISAYSRSSSQIENSSVTRCREYALQNQRPEPHYQRLIPRPPVVTPAPPLPPKRCNTHSDHTHQQTHSHNPSEEDPGWVVYGYV